MILDRTWHGIWHCYIHMWWWESWPCPFLTWDMYHRINVPWQPCKNDLENVCLITTTTVTIAMKLLRRLDLTNYRHDSIICYIIIYRMRTRHTILMFVKHSIEIYAYQKGVECEENDAQLIQDDDQMFIHPF